MDRFPGLADSTPGSNAALPADAAVSAGKALIQRLIPLPDSQFVGPLAVLPKSVQPREAAPGIADLVMSPASDPAVSIVAQAASVLNEEMAKGVLAARDVPGGMTSNVPGMGHPVARQINELLEQFSKLWAPGPGGGTQGPSVPAGSSGNSESLVTLRAKQAAKPGARVTISIALRNRESRTVHLVPCATDLISSQGGRVSSAALVFAPAQVTLAPEEQRDLEIAAVIPSDAPPGCYWGLLVVKGLDYLRALIVLEVADGGLSSSYDRSINVSAPPHPAASGASYASQPRAGTPAGVHAEGALMREAIRLAEDGELGNTDAIRLLHLPHRPEEIKEVLLRFDALMTREARSKLTLESLVPLPDGIDNQRFEPIFERYPISGRTYATASGTILPSELQYYNGEMVQVHGACSNVAQVRQVLAGSGYQPMTMRGPDGRESAIAQLWAHQFTDTSMRPYNAAFVIIVALPSEVPADNACIAADASGTSSVLPMFDGTYDSVRGVYENRARLFFIRLLDSTQVAIEVGRERMGTDKRPGAIQVTHAGTRRLFSVADGAGNPVASIDFDAGQAADDIRPSLQRAASAAGISLRAASAGTEHVYPVVARIGNGPVITWQWRTDVPARLQRAMANSVRFDARSEEGELLIQWGFEPQVLGHIPNVRGVVTGLT